LRQAPAASDSHACITDAGLLFNGVVFASLSLLSMNIEP
jgi:hypothetical protein